MSVLDGPGEGTWSVFAQKVVEERDELRHKLAGEAAHIKSLEDLLVDAVRERDALQQKLDELPAMYREDIESLNGCVERLGAENTKLRAEVEMLRGVGCRETKEGEPESGPCGVCLRCAEERGRSRAQAQLENVLDASKEGAWMARALDAERERDELKTRLAHAEADAEQAVHNEALLEHYRIVAWMQNRVVHGTTASMQTLDELVSICDAIHRGEHE